MIENFSSSFLSSTTANTANTRSAVLPQYTAFQNQNFKDQTVLQRDPDLAQKLDHLILKKASEQQMIDAVMRYLMTNDMVSLDLAEMIGLTYFNPKSDEINVSSLKKRLHVALVKELSEHKVAALMNAAQTGDRQAYRHLLGILNEVVLVFLSRHFKHSFDHALMASSILKTVHEVRHTYVSGHSFMDWFFAIAKTKIKSVLKKEKLAIPDDFIKSDRLISEVQLAYLSVRYIGGDRT